jgi:DNA-binding NarL/FixJ family response regulator
MGTVCDVLAESGFNVVGRARSAAEGKAKIERRLPTVAIVDILLSDGSGIDLTRELRRSAAQTSVILYIDHGDGALLSEALQAGARGVVLKDAPLTNLVRAIETVASGETYVDPGLAD